MAHRMKSIKIASWNINSVRFRLPIVERFLKEHAPDVLCLQETKATDDVFPEGPLRQLGYTHFVLNGQPMHHGVAIVAKIPIHQASRHDWQANGEARHVGARLPNGWRVENVYVPAGGEEPDFATNPKFQQKLDFLGRMTDWSAKLAEPTLLVGDFNVAPLESDVWNHKQLRNVVSHTEIEIDLLDKLKASHNWVDLGRHFVPAPERLYTWWSYRAKDYTQGDRGRRLDHMWASPEVAEAAVSHKLHEPCRSWEKPSDHIPIVTEFKI
jgi:exodeoxyribonuclease III